MLNSSSEALLLAVFDEFSLLSEILLLVAFDEPSGLLEVLLFAESISSESSLSDSSSSVGAGGVGEGSLRALWRSRCVDDLHRLPQHDAFGGTRAVLCILNRRGEKGGGRWTCFGWTGELPSLV